MSNIGDPSGEAITRGNPPAEQGRQLFLVRARAKEGVAIPQQSTEKRSGSGSGPGNQPPSSLSRRTPPISRDRKMARIISNMVVLPHAMAAARRTGRPSTRRCSGRPRSPGSTGSGHQGGGRPGRPGYAVRRRMVLPLPRDSLPATGAVESSIFNPAKTRPHFRSRLGQRLVRCAPHLLEISSAPISRHQSMPRVFMSATMRAGRVPGDDAGPVAPAPEQEFLRTRPTSRSESTNDSCTELAGCG